MLFIKIKKFLLPSILILNSLVQSCSNSTRSFSKINVKIPENIIISKSDIKSIFKKHKKNNEAESVDVVIYYFSPGSERLMYSGENHFVQTFKIAEIKILLKFKRNKQIEDIIFVSASGRNRNEMLKNISFEIDRVIQN